MVTVPRFCSTVPPCGHTQLNSLRPTLSPCIFCVIVNGWVLDHTESAHRRRWHIAERVPDTAYAIVLLADCRFVESLTRDVSLRVSSSVRAYIPAGLEVTRPSRLLDFYFINQSCIGKPRQVPTERRILLLCAATASNQRSQASVCGCARAAMKHGTAAPSTKSRIGFLTKSSASRGRRRKRKRGKRAMQLSPTCC